MSDDAKEAQPGQIGKVNKNLRRLNASLASNGLSGNVVQSEAGKTALSVLLAESLDGDFRPDVAREAIKKVMKLG